MPSPLMSVKSERPIRPGGCSWRKNTSPLGAPECPPFGDATFQCPAHPGRHLGMSAAELVEDRHRAETGCGFQHRHDLALPHAGEGIGTPALARLALLGGEPWIGLDPVGGG